MSVAADGSPRRASIASAQASILEAAAEAKERAAGFDSLAAQLSQLTGMVSSLADFGGDEPSLVDEPRDSVPPAEAPGDEDAGDGVIGVFLQNGSTRAQHEISQH